MTRVEESEPRPARGDERLERFVSIRVGQRPGKREADRPSQRGARDLEARVSDALGHERTTDECGRAKREPNGQLLGRRSGSRRRRSHVRPAQMQIHAAEPAAAARSDVGRGGGGGLERWSQGVVVEDASGDEVVGRVEGRHLAIEQAFVGGAPLGAAERDAVALLALDTGTELQLCVTEDERREPARCRGELCALAAKQTTCRTGPSAVEGTGSVVAREIAAGSVTRPTCAGRAAGASQQALERFAERTAEGGGRNDGRAVSVSRVDRIDEGRDRRVSPDEQRSRRNCDVDGECAHGAASSRRCSRLDRATVVWLGM